METWTRIAWMMLALAHLPPAAVALEPTLVERLYGVAPTGDAGVLLAHRGALFLGVVALSLMAAWDAGARRAAALAVALSVVGFLVTYARAGWPPGPLRTIAWVDALALAPLALVAVTAIRGP